jgi:hypothetical protein
MNLLLLTVQLLVAGFASVGLLWLVMQIPPRG